MLWRVSAVFLLELSSVGEFLDFVSNAQRAPLEELQRGHAIAMPLREGPPQSCYRATRRHWARKTCMLRRNTRGGNDHQWILESNGQDTLGVNHTHYGWVEMDGTIGLHDCDYRPKLN